jgi:hypothetical protein
MQEFFDDSRHADSVPLDEFCAMGGAPDPDDSPEIHVNGAEVAGKYCTGTLTAYFNEVVYGGGCPDMPTVKPRQGDVSFTVVLDDGTVQFERDYDPR